MNALFNSALRQSQALKKDLGSFSENPSEAPAALQGQISASLATLSRTIDDYDAMAKRELVPAKQEQAFQRVKNFRKELSECKEAFDDLKKQRAEIVHTQNRVELLGRRGHNSQTPDNPYAYNTATASASASAFAPKTAHARTSSVNPFPAEQASMESHLYRENNFFGQTHNQLDEFLDRGRAVLSDLNDQRAILKGTQKKLYSVGNTLGISRDTIRMVERRAKEDKWIFYGGIVVFLLFCYFVVKWLG